MIALPRFALAVLAASVLALPAAAQPISASEQGRIDALVTKTLSETGVPSASIALVRDGRIVLAKAYGTASPSLGAARPDPPYQIASNSKQFTAMALLLLEDEGKLSLDDKVSKWVPGVTGGDRIALHQLLSHTAGLQDYWPQDYSFAAMGRPTAPQGIVDRWAKKPLDYAPGTRWQYSNTGYVVAGLVAKKAAGEPPTAYLKRRIFTPLGMRPVNLGDTNSPAFPAGYTRYALGAVRLATPAARGWLYAAGDYAMTATDLAKWNIARLDRALLPADDWRAQEAVVTLADGTATGYGLGVSSGTANGRRFINHGGASVGFLSQNTVYPDDRAAIVVLTNGEYSGAINALTAGLTEIILPPVSPPAADPPQADRTANARALYESLREGRLDRAALTDNNRGYFTPVALADYRASLSALGSPTSFVATGAPRLRGGFVNRNYRIVAGGRTMRLITYAEPGASGRWEQFLVMPQ